METTTKVFIILQLASKGDLLEYINSRPMLSEDEVRMLFCQLAAAMAYCHKEQVVHRDLKCENILIGGDDKLKVTGKSPESFLVKISCHSCKPSQSNQFSQILVSNLQCSLVYFHFNASHDLQCNAVYNTCAFVFSSNTQ